MSSEERRTKLPDLNDESLGVFTNGLAKFNEAFCSLMFSGSDFTLRLEVRGNKNKLLHCRCYQDDIERPKDSGANKK